MLGTSLLLFAAVVQVADPGSVGVRSDAIVDGSRASGDLNTHSGDYGYLPGRRSFYPYPRHRHVDVLENAGGSFGRPLRGSDDGSPNLDGKHGSPYYGANYGAPYHGGGYYDGGVYYRERRD